MKQAWLGLSKYPGQPWKWADSVELSSRYHPWGEHTPQPHSDWYGLLSSDRGGVWGYQDGSQTEHYICQRWTGTASFILKYRQFSNVDCCNSQLFRPLSALLRCLVPIAYVRYTCTCSIEAIPFLYSLVNC